MRFKREEDHNLCLLLIGSHRALNPREESRRSVCPASGRLRQSNAQLVRDHTDLVYLDCSLAVTHFKEERPYFGRVSVEPRTMLASGCVLVGVSSVARVPGLSILSLLSLDSH